VEDPELEKKIEFQFTLRTSISQILLALGKSLFALSMI